MSGEGGSRRGGPSITSGDGLLAVPLALFLLAGCCTVPPAERYFDRKSPFDALVGFAYAVETGQWRFAYNCLDERSKELITFTRFKLALRFGVRIPDQEIPIRDLILSAERRREWEEKEDGNARVRVRYVLLDGAVVERFIFLYGEREDLAAAQGRRPIWWIDLERTISAMQAAEGRMAATGAALVPE